MIKYAFTKIRQIYYLVDKYIFYLMCFSREHCNKWSGWLMLKLCIEQLLKYLCIALIQNWCNFHVLMHTIFSIESIKI